MTEQHKIRFTNRRAMAWISFGLICFLSILIISAGLFSPTAAQNIENLSFAITTVYTILISIVGAYFGVTGLVDIKKG